MTITMNCPECRGTGNGIDLRHRNCTRCKGNGSISYEKRTPTVTLFCEECGCMASVATDAKMFACPRCTLIQKAE